MAAPATGRNVHPDNVLGTADVQQLPRGRRTAELLLLHLEDTVERFQYVLEHQPIAGGGGARRRCILGTLHGRGEKRPGHHVPRLDLAARAVGKRHRGQ